MNPKPFLHVRLFLPALILVAAIILSSCTSMATTEAPAHSATEISVPPPATPTYAGTIITPTPDLIIPVTGGEEARPVIPETRRLTLEFPPKIKAGVASEIVRLTLEVDDLGNITPTAQFGGNVVEGEVVTLPDLYDTHNVTAEARFDIAGMLVQPAGSTFQPLNRGQSVTFHWSIRPMETGSYRGTVWLHLNFVQRQTGEESRMALSAQIVEVEAVDFFGFSVNFVRTSGVVGSVLGIIVGFPFFDDAVKYLWNRRKKRKKTAKR